jgi:2-polyprenyl-3-methyl-5-hydroxy-6-metoxy-1,4-benzoquinol methylase
VLKYSDLQQLRHFLYAKRRPLPKSAEEIIASDLYKAWWFYDAELFPGVVREGIFPKTMPLPARMLLRNCDLSNCDCLDIGSMEGLIPILMRKQGAREVLATDFNYHCYQKLLALASAHQADIRFKKVGLLYDLNRKIPDRRLRGFDVINVSGVLYHVFSPMHVLAGLRPLLKKNGIMIISTNVIDRDDCSMEFNESGKMQEEPNTFWYMSIHMLDYMIRYFQLLPLDYVLYKYPPSDAVRHAEGFDVYYLGVACRATTDRGAQFNDEWLSRSLTTSWEYRLCDQAMLEAQATSTVDYRGERGAVDLAQEIAREPPLQTAPTRRDTHCLLLEDPS